MSYSDKAKQKLFYAGDTNSAITKSKISSAEIIADLENIYRVEADPAQEYKKLTLDLWEDFKVRLDNVPYRTSPPDAFKPDWLMGLRSSKRPVKIVYPEVSGVVEKCESGGLATGDVDSDSISEANAEEKPEKKEMA